MQVHGVQSYFFSTTEWVPKRLELGSELASLSFPPCLRVKQGLEMGRIFR